MSASDTAPRIDADRLWRRVMDLATFTRPDVPWTRRAFGPEFLASREWLIEQFRTAGLTVHVDAAGNLIGRREGRRPGLPPLVSGSHCDTVPAGGRFDGIVGVLAALEVSQCMYEDGVVIEHPLEIIDFLSEEPSDYGVSCVGSRAMAGVLTQSMLEQKNPMGECLSEAIDRIGGSVRGLPGMRRTAGAHAGFVELHIEQGPVLQTRSLEIGVVSNIVGIRRVSLTVVGQADHAGTTPMNIRHDALAGAAEIIRAVRQQASSHQEGEHYVVATIGWIANTPNAANAVPGCVEMTLEVRSDSSDILHGFAEQVMATVAPELNALRVQASFTELTYAAPTDASDVIMAAIGQAAKTLGLSSMVMPSGAGHDAAYMAAIGPMGMIFVPCLDGRSHCPQEWIEPHQLANGARVLYQTLCNLDRTLAAGR